MHSDLTQNATERFTGLAEVYARSRPDYPAAILDHLEAHCGLRPGSSVIDIGAGTGISTRWLATRGWRLLGIEPNDDMRRQAEADSDSAIRYQLGSGEKTGLPDATANAVVCCQAFHWLDPALALPEFERILKPGGWAVLIWNERDAGDPFTADFGAIIRASRESARMEDARQQAGRAFLAFDRLIEKTRIDFPHRQTLDEEGLIGRALSMSHTPREGAAKASLVESLRQCFGRWQRGGQVEMRYVTSVYLGRKPG